MLHSKPGMKLMISTSAALICALVSTSCGDDDILSLEGTVPPAETDDSLPSLETAEGIDFIVGPQVPMGESPWDFFDANQEARALFHYETAMDPPDFTTWYNAYYYDLVLSFYNLWARTEDSTYLTYARNSADAWATYMENTAGWQNSNISPRHAGYGGLIIRALDGRPELWPGIVRLANEQYNIWLGSHIDDSELYVGIRDGAFALLAVATLAQVHPDGVVRADMQFKALDIAVNYHARLQSDDGGWYWRDTDGAVCDGCFFSQPFMVGMLLEALIATHQVTGDPTVRTSVINAVDWLWNEGYEQTEPTNMIGSGTQWRAMRYFVWRDSDGQDRGSALLYGSQDGAIRDARQLNATTIHAFGYAYRLTGETKYLTWGDDVFSSTFGKGEGPGADSYYALADFRGKEYNQSYRTAGRYLAWR